jgi:hypothetical protein
MFVCYFEVMYFKFSYNFRVKILSIYHGYLKSLCKLYRGNGANKL